MMRGTVAVSLSLLLAVALMPSAAPGVSAIEVTRWTGGSGAPLRSVFDATHNSGKYGWVLKSPLFQALSPVAKRAVLRSAGMMSPRPESQRAGGMVPSSSAGTGQPLENLRVNNPALDLTYHTHDNSSVATDGTYIAIGFDDAAGATGGIAISSDGGNTFTQTSVPEPALAIDEGDGAVAFAPNGTLFYSCLVEQETLGVAVASSTNHGMTFSQPAIVSGTIGGALAVQDAPWTCADQSSDSAFKGNVYVSWATFGNTNTISFTRSTDSGATFQTPVSLPATPNPPSTSSLFFVEGPTMAIGPNGELYVFYYASYLGTLGSQVFVVKSTDGGTTFSTPAVVASYFTQESIFEPPEQGVPVYTGGQFGVASTSYPRAAVDPIGNIGVVFEGTSLTATGGPDPSNVYFVKSSDGGATFSAPIELNDDGGMTTQWRPSIAATASGVFGVKWFDRRNDPARDSLNDVYMAISTDGGNTFGKNFRVTNTSWLFGESDPPEVGDNPSFHGSYDSMTALGESFLCSWSDERSGKSDIYFSSVPSSFDSSSPDFAITPAELYGSVVAGGASATIPINITSVNQMTTAVSMSGSAPVPGISVSFSGASIVLPGSQNILTVSASASAAPGLFIITLTGTAGSLVRNTNLNLTVFAPGQQGGAPINITNTRGNTFANDQSMTCDSAGNLHLCFLDDTASPGTLRMYYSKSTNGGQTFTTPVVVGGGSSLALQRPSGKAAREAKEVGNGTLNFHPSLMSGSASGSSATTAFAPSTLYLLNDPLIEPCIAVDQSGNIYISVPGIAMVKNEFPGDVLIFKSTDGGQTFSSSTVAVTSSCNLPIDAEAIATDKNGDLMIAYAPFCKEHGLFEAGIYVTMSTNGGSTFSSPVKVSGKDLINANSDDIPVRIAFDSNGGVYVLYSSSTGAFQGLGGESTMSIRMAVASDGVHFEEPVTVYEAIFAQFGVDENIFFDSSAAAPDILIDSHNDIYVSMIGETPQGEDLYVMSSTNGGASFSAPVNLTKSLDVTFS
ncbi:MAG TPA: sialidase family protein, partial [Blastocatellia bacterium]